MQKHLKAADNRYGRAKVLQRDSFVFSSLWHFTFFARQKQQQQMIQSRSQSIIINWLCGSWDSSPSPGMEGGREGERVVLWLFPMMRPVFCACSDGTPSSAPCWPWSAWFRADWLFPRVLNDRRTQGPLRTSSTS